MATKGSLTAAAQAEGVAPAIMGRRLDALEEHLGVKLLVRTTRRISLTHEGSAFLEDCQRLLTDVANAEASVSAGASRPPGICASPPRPGLAAAMWRRWCRGFTTCTPTSPSRST